MIQSYPAAANFLNQNSREPVTEPDEMVPLWKILHLAGADWTYGTKGWAAENYCMFAQNWEAWVHIVRVKAQAVDDLGCKVWLNTADLPFTWHSWRKRKEISWTRFGGTRTVRRKPSLNKKTRLAKGGLFIDFYRIFIWCFGWAGPCQFIPYG